MGSSDSYSVTECRNRVLERPHAGVPQGCGRRIEAAKLAGERADALVKTVGLPRLPRKVLELLCADVTKLFSVIRAKKPALVGSDRVGRRGLILAVCDWNRINRRAARLKRDGLRRSAVVGQSGSRKQWIDSVAVIRGAGLGESTTRVIGNVEPSVGDRSMAICAGEADRGRLERAARQDGALETRGP